MSPVAVNAPSDTSGISKHPGIAKDKFTMPPGINEQNDNIANLFYKESAFAPRTRKRAPRIEPKLTRSKASTQDRTGR